MLTKISNFGGNYRLPAGIPAEDIATILREQDIRLLKYFFTPETVAYLLTIPDNKRPITTLVDGFFALEPWANMSVPFISANVTFSILPREEVAKKLSPLTYTYALIANYYKQLRKAYVDWSDGYVTYLDETNNYMKVKIVSNYFGMWIDAGQQVSVDGVPLEILAYNYDARVITMEYLPIQIGQQVTLKNLNIKIKKYEEIANLIY